MKRSAILSERARPHRKIFAASANSCCRFCCATGGSTVDASIGPRCICTGWRNKSSITRHSRLFSRTRYTQSTMPPPVCVGSTNTWRKSCRAGRWRRWSKPIKRCAASPLQWFVVEIGDLRRFDDPRQLMAFLGLVPSERSTGERVRRAGLTLAGNKRARRVLIEGAWSYRYPARVSQALQTRLEGLPKTVRAIAWKAQIRLCARYRRLTAVGKKRPLVTAAIAREMAAFLWAIAQHVAPAA